jgi:multidrug resistance efflux pump
VDFKREVRKKSLLRRYWYLFLIVGFIFLAITMKSSLGGASYILDKGDLQLAKVERGDFQVNVRGLGVLKPRNIHWASTQVSGRVEQLLVKPGTKVVSGDTLAILSNPQLLSNLESARWELEATKAESYAAYVSMESQLVDLENAASAAHYNYLGTKLQLDAESDLLSHGNGSISKLDYERTKLSVEQQKQEWRAQQLRVAKMQDRLKAMKESQQARLGMMESHYQRVIQQVEHLAVVATSDGIVQQVTLTLGQQASIGTGVALIADQTSLIAEVQVQELQIREVVIGQPVLIDTRKSQIAGVVSRIDPAVNSGVVQVDVSLLDTLPPEARPDLNIEALIEISHLKDTLYVKRPAFAAKFSNKALYQLSKDGAFAKKQWVKLGQSSVNRIQVLSGLTIGDTIIISDTSDWEGHSEILIH